MDNWLSDDVPKLADYDRRQFPEQNMRWDYRFVISKTSIVIRKKRKMASSVICSDQIEVFNFTKR